MKNIHLISYSVKGIKSLDKEAKLSFYKKTFKKDFSIRNYNIKGIYGTNGAGKSAIVTSVRILKNLLINVAYLNNPLVQKQLHALINKKIGYLEISVEYAVALGDELKLYNYQVKVTKSKVNKFYISNESLKTRNAFSHNRQFDDVFIVKDGNLLVSEKSEFTENLIERTKNLLSDASLTANWINRIVDSDLKRPAGSKLWTDLALLYLLAESLFVYLDRDDDHTDFVINKLLEQSEDAGDSTLDLLIKHKVQLDESQNFMFSLERMFIKKENYQGLEKEVKRLYEFLHIFKHDLQEITIDRRDDKEYYACNLVMKYDDYSVDTEFESTGIRKLIKLFTYLDKMVKGNIVFIDEMDSNLHDVYLCALLEYLMEYGEGQLCFTTHNIGPMDILKKNKMAIDFLSVDHQIYSWTTSGNYSPSKLYRNGMIEGSPFNVYSIDFLEAFQAEGDN